MLPAYAWKILRADLSTGNVAKEPLSPDFVRKYIGGKGLGARLLYDEVKHGIDPLGPENKLIFTTGPATGTIVPHKGHCISYKSPLTGIYGSSSAGGFFGDALKRAGYDVLIIGGRSKKPVYLWIDDEEVQIIDAKHLWGKNTFETNTMIKEELGDEEISVSRIGIAGENLVRFAGIFNDYSRTAGRCGAGSVMGSKNLKAVAVRGTKTIEVAKIDEMLEFMEEFYKTVKETPATGTAYPRWGTPGGVSTANVMGVFPTRYWHKGTLNEYENINAEAIRGRLLVKDRACGSCVVNCSKLSVVKRGPYAGAVAELDYETVYAFGGLCENSNLGSIVKANELCDEFGMDTMSAGNVIAFAMECYERGIITIKDTEGIELVWGNHEAIIQMVKKIATRTGLGNILADGVREAAKRLGKGAEEFAVHVKGLEPSGYDPRGMKGVALAFAVADRGACHLPSSVYTYELRGDVDRLSVEGKAAFLKNLEHRFAVCDTLILCRFFRDVYPWKTLVRLFPLLIGVEMNEADLKRIAERIVTLTRAFNVREGISRKDDFWPDKFYEEPLPHGSSGEGYVLKKNEFNRMLDEYYELSGWDHNGIPTEKKLVELGLADVARKIETIRRKTVKKNV
jgi:aldehyde:ferredoxin oxidoreductase